MQFVYHVTMMMTSQKVGGHWCRGSITSVTEVIFTVYMRHSCVFLCTLFAPYKSQLRIRDVRYMIHCDSGSQHKKYSVCIGMLAIFRMTIFLNS